MNLWTVKNGTAGILGEFLPPLIFLKRTGVLSLYARICCKIWTGLEVVNVGLNNDGT